MRENHFKKLVLKILLLSFTYVFLTIFMMARAFSFDSPNGYWLLYGKDGVTKRLISQISVKPVPGSQAKQLSFHLITVWPHKDLESNVFVCTKCRGRLQNQPLDVISPLWGNVYSSTTQRWDKGALLQSHLGRVLSTSISFDQGYQHAKMRVYELLPLLGVTLHWVRLTSEQVDELKKEARSLWSLQWSTYPVYYSQQKALYRHYASTGQRRNKELMQQINAQ